eukprot:651035-Pyramimonas_sp.AAC.1
MRCVHGLRLTEHRLESDAVVGSLSASLPGRSSLVSEPEFWTCPRFNVARSTLSGISGDDERRE